jgi:signal transduction histidine kinase
VDSLSTVHLDHLSFSYRFFKATGDKGIEPWIGLLLRETTNENFLRDQLVVAEKIAGLSSFASGIAHELNNPLQSIIAFADAITNESELPKSKEYARKILDGANNMKLKILDTIGSIRSLAHAAPEDVNVIDILNSSIETALAEFGATEIDVIKNFEVSQKIKACPNEIRQIFNVLVSNAIGVMDGKGQLNISSVRASSGNTILQIQDTGPGIPRECITRVFDPFFTTKGSVGTGLGLNIVYRLVEKNGGRIDVFSPPDEGTTFIITLPAE